MEIPFYLAMTPCEIRQADDVPGHLSWMSAHFSKENELLCNLPENLPENSILVIDDAFPISEHNSALILEQLKMILNNSDLIEILLDFQREYNPKLKAFSAEVAGAFPNRVAVTPNYDNGKTIVFLPPAPPNIPIQQYLVPWRDRDTWLDLTMSKLAMRIKQNSVIMEDTCEVGKCPHISPELSTHYGITATNEEILIQFQRTKDDCNMLLQKAAEFGVTRGIGLYQEFINKTAPKNRGGY